MRAPAIFIASLCAFGAVTPALALEFCDKIQEPDKRMACLQEHISHLEESLLALSTQVTDLRNALKLKLDADAVYKWQHVGQGTCLGFSGKEEGVDLQSCDHPDSWKLLRGSQKPKDAVKKKPQENERPGAGP